MKHKEMRSCMLILPSLFLFLLLVSGIPRLIGGAASPQERKTNPIPVCEAELDALAAADFQIQAETLREDLKDKSAGLIRKQGNRVQNKAEAPARVCDANGNILNPYHGRYQAMVYQTFAPEKGFV